MKINHVSKSEFKAKALEFFRQIEASGESLIVTDHGKPALEVRPYHEIKRNPLHALRGSVMYYENLTEPISVGDWEALQ